MLIAEYFERDPSDFTSSSAAHFPAPSRDAAVPLYTPTASAPYNAIVCLMIHATSEIASLHGCVVDSAPRTRRGEVTRSGW
jgi:hypothetical protein